MIYYYGGGFDPFTKAHAKIIDTVVNWMSPGDVFYIGVTTVEDYKKYTYDFSKRYEIIYSHMFETYLTPKLFKFKWQLLNQFDNTWNFLHKFLPEEKQKEICLVIGADEYHDLSEKKWEHSDDILNTYLIRTINRVDSISATKVRELLANNATWDDLKNYITENTFKYLTDETK
jgi:nicotinic acid mononucleotide adenylyltransferase